MAQIAQAGNTVRVHYKGTLTNGTLFDSSEGRSPLEFILGSGMVIKGFDEGITGMSIGQTKQVHIPVEDAYGYADENLVFVFERSQLPPDLDLEVGMTLNMNQEGSAESIPVVVTELNDTHLVVDANHPLANQDLIFDIELVEIL